MMLKYFPTDSTFKPGNTFIYFERTCFFHSCELHKDRETCLQSAILLYFFQMFNIHTRNSIRLQKFHFSFKNGKQKKYIYFFFQIFFFLKNLKYFYFTLSICNNPKLKILISTLLDELILYQRIINNSCI